MVKYPRYPKNKDLRCKLTEQDIKELRAMVGDGVSKIEIAKRFKITMGVIYYWLLSDQERKERNRRQYLLWEIDPDKVDKKQKQSRSYKRKYRLMPEFRKYHRLRSAKYQKNKRKRI